MKLEFTLNNQNSGPFYVGYAPVKFTLKNTDVQPGGGHTVVTIKNHDIGTSGQIVFYADHNASEVEELNVSVPDDGSEVIFLAGGKFGKPSKNNMDDAIDCVAGGVTVLQVKVMVRVRKNALDLSKDERNNFLKAFAAFVKAGKYKRFLDMHGEAADDEIHGRASFLPWHRIFLLDLERNLQEINPLVTIPYWDFQKPAKEVFTPDFMGVPDSSGIGTLRFSSGHPFEDLRIVSGSKLARKPRFDTENDEANVQDFEDTMNRVGGFAGFCDMEGDPHGFAHTSFDRGFSPIGWSHTATQDPLFYMLHANIDRLWAEWQTRGQDNIRFDGTKLEAYNPQKPGAYPARVGDFPTDTMWPWNGIKGNGTAVNPRPTITAPGGPLLPSPITVYPGGKPLVVDSIDYQGRITQKPLGFDYDTVPYLNAADFQAGHASSAWAKVNFTKNLIKLSLAKESENIDKLINFKAAATIEEITATLGEVAVLDEQDSINKALAIFMDAQQDAGVRVLALSRLTRAIGNDQKLIEYVISVAADSGEAENLRREALRTLDALEFSSVKVKSLQPEITQMLRGMATDPNLEIRKLAVASLAQSKDEFIQSKLIEGIENPSQALVSEELAVHLLGLDIKSSVFPLLRKVVANSSNNKSRAEALFILGGDPESKGLVIDVFNNKKERFDVRMNSLLSLQQLDNEQFVDIAKRAIIDNDEHNELRTIGINGIIPLGLPSSDEFTDQLKALNDASLSKPLSAGINIFLGKK